MKTPAAAVMVRPHHFHPNPETAADNAYHGGTAAPASELPRRPNPHVTDAAAQLRSRIHT